MNTKNCKKMICKLFGHRITASVTMEDNGKLNTFTFCARSGVETGHVSVEIPNFIHSH